MRSSKYWTSMGTGLPVASLSLVPPIIAAVEAMATVGEIADTLRRVFGEYQETGLDL